MPQTTVLPASQVLDVNRHDIVQSPCSLSYESDDSVITNGRLMVRSAKFPLADNSVVLPFPAQRYEFISEQSSRICICMYFLKWLRQLHRTEIVHDTNCQIMGRAVFAALLSNDVMKEQYGYLETYAPHPVLADFVPGVSCMRVWPVAKTAHFVDLPKKTFFTPKISGSHGMLPESKCTCVCSGTHELFCDWWVSHIEEQSDLIYYLRRYELSS